MKEKYEKSVLTVTRFSKEDVITTSEDRNNAYNKLSELSSTSERVPQAPHSWN